MQQLDEHFLHRSCYSTGGAASGEQFRRLHLKGTFLEQSEINHKFIIINGPFLLLIVKRFMQLVLNKLNSTVPWTE